MSCPHAEQAHPAVREAKAIVSQYPVLNPTGCSAQFCEGGRMIHSSEPRVGENKHLSVVRAEAVDFLSQLHRDGVIPSKNSLEKRKVEVIGEIETKSATTLIRSLQGGKSVGCVGGAWSQNREELEHGIRLAWKHSRRCIMRSQYEDLRLCDLRNIRGSEQMGSMLISELRKAFNNGDILPTVFVFPPREIDKVGPMIWNSQLLSFAGYMQEDGSILGDPLNVDLTKAIIELGWRPPPFRTRWDMLPLVTMAEGEDPVITELPKDMFPLVEISHPQHTLAFDKLGLKWVPAPALSRMGFDIGGVQYTATPFIGWFMDAEIGVRNLADRERYNVLPSLIKALGWIDSVERLDEIHEADRLRLLSNAQSELNYAVHYSFQQANIRMTDTLTASAMYCNYDDEHLRKYGFRLPADPYWLAPPQGSIVPLWHRGGSPNYQPKPLIARHLQDPVKVWRRKTKQQEELDSLICPARRSNWPATRESLRHVRIGYCSSGTTAVKLARKAEAYLSRLNNKSVQYHVSSPQPLNTLSQDTLQSGDVVLLIASSSGHGEIPANGKDFENALSRTELPSGLEWAVFGNGNSSYSDSFNGAAKKIRNILLRRGASFLFPDFFYGDTLIDDPPFRQLNTWLAAVSMRLFNFAEEEATDLGPESQPTPGYNIFQAFSPANVSSCTAISSNHRRLFIDVENSNPSCFSHAQFLIPNSHRKTQEILSVIGLTGKEVLSQESPRLCLHDILSHFVDVDRPFKHIRWIHTIKLNNEEEDALLQQPLLQSLKILKKRRKIRPQPSAFFSALPLGRPRHFSLASAIEVNKNTSRLEFIVKTHAKGKFSSEFLSIAAIGASLRVRLSGQSTMSMIKNFSKPIIAFATGSGIAPVKYILQQRLKISQESPSSLRQNLEPGPISLFVGFRGEDAQMVSDALHDGIRSNMIDILSLTPSNDKKWRAQDCVFNPGFKSTIERKVKKEECFVFVCASSQAANEFSSNLNAIIGVDVQKELGDRYLEEVFEVAQL